MSDRDFLLGLNYWPRRKAMYWWQSFDAAEVDHELGQIADLGVRLVRFCLMWEDFQPEPDRIEGAQLHNLQTVMDLAAKHGLLAMPTLLVGNMSGIMWFPPWAFTDKLRGSGPPQISQGHYTDRQLRSPFDDPGMLRAEVFFAGQAAEAVAGHPALHSWDLANEIDQAFIPTDSNAGWLWAWCLARAIHGVDPGVPITYGAHGLSLTTRGLTIPALAPSLEYLSMHGYPIYSEVARGPLDPELVPFMTWLSSRLGSKPTLMQEFGVCTAPPGEPSHTIQDDFLGQMKPQFMASEEDAAAYYAAVLDRLWETGAMGALAWDYADYPPELWNRPPLDRAKRERTFGIFRSDGSSKPGAEVMAGFAEEMRTGAIEDRLGPHGGKRVELEVDPEGYYVDPERSFREAYGAYLEEIRVPDPAGVGREIPSARTPR
jgi:endo-1,4-beta-mannosidase